MASKILVIAYPFAKVSPAKIFHYTVLNLRFVHNSKLNYRMSTVCDSECFHTGIYSRSTLIRLSDLHLYRDVWVPLGPVNWQDGVVPLLKIRCHLIKYNH